MQRNQCIPHNRLGLRGTPRAENPIVSPNGKICWLGSDFSVPLLAALCLQIASPPNRSLRAERGTGEGGVGSQMWEGGLSGIFFKSRIGEDDASAARGFCPRPRSAFPRRVPLLPSTSPGKQEARDESRDRQNSYSLPMWSSGTPGTRDHR